MINYDQHQSTIHFLSIAEIHCNEKCIDQNICAQFIFFALDKLIAMMYVFTLLTMEPLCWKCL